MQGWDRPYLTLQVSLSGSLLLGSLDPPCCPGLRPSFSESWFPHLKWGHGPCSWSKGKMG